MNLKLVKRLENEQKLKEIAAKRRIFYVLNNFDTRCDGMRAENSAGGIVFYNGKVLLLQKKCGFWVLPKGRIEKEEECYDAAIREVFEESGIEAEIIKYIDAIHYTYHNYWTKYEWVLKRVDWYAMRAITCTCKPQAEEGFLIAKFVEPLEAIEMLKYDDERRVLNKALSIISDI